MSSDLGASGALAIAAAVRAGKTTRTKSPWDALKRIDAFDGTLNCFTEVLATRALAEARHVDETIARGTDPGPLAGVPFAVKNLLDIQGIPTLAGRRFVRGRTHPRTMPHLSPRYAAQEPC